MAWCVGIVGTTVAAGCWRVLWQRSAGYGTAGPDFWQPLLTAWSDFFFFSFFLWQYPQFSVCVSLSLCVSYVCMCERGGGGGGGGGVSVCAPEENCVSTGDVKGDDEWALSCVQTTCRAGVFCPAAVCWYNPRKSTQKKEEKMSWDWPCFSGYSVWNPPSLWLEMTGLREREREAQRDRERLYLLEGGRVGGGGGRLRLREVEERGGRGEERKRKRLIDCGGGGGGTGERDWETWGEKREIEIPG